MKLRKTYTVTLKCVVGRAPVKAIKNVKPYSWNCGCDKYAQKGTWIVRVAHKDVELVECRTDVSFHLQRNTEHVCGQKPFCDLPIDLIKAFPTDHWECLRLLLAWIMVQEVTWSDKVKETSEC